MADWKEQLKAVTDKKSPVRIVAGVALIIVGSLALITPFTPGSWLIFVGLAMLGIRIAAWEQIKRKFLK